MLFIQNPYLLVTPVMHERDEGCGLLSADESSDVDGTSLLIINASFVGIQVADG